MCQVLSSSAEVGFWDDMLVEVLAKDQARDFVIDEVGRLEELSSVLTRMAVMEPEELLDFGGGCGRGVCIGAVVLLCPIGTARDFAGSRKFVIVGNARKKHAGGPC